MPASLKSINAGDLVVSRRSLGDRGADKLRETILTGAFEPGERLTEENIAAKFGLSRSTIRACLIRLVHEGLIIQEPYLGYSVRSLTSRDAWELFTLRNALESFAAKVLSESMTAKKKQRLDVAYKNVLNAVNARSRSGAVEADFKLHETIAELTEHSALQRHYQLIAGQVRLYQSLVSKFLSLEDYVATHQPLIEAICAGDSMNAQRFAAEHNTGDGQMLVAWLKDSEDKALREKKGLAG